MSFQEWVSRVDAIIYETVGCSVHDLADCFLRDWYEDGMKPTEAAAWAIEGG